MAEAQKVDGRRARGVRTRNAIVSSLLDLIASGDIAPTAQRIADGAGVSVRSVYQHFSDVEGLYADASEQTFALVRSSAAEIDPALPLERRIEEFTAERTATLESLKSFTRATRLIEPTSATIRENRLELQRWGRDRIARAFAPELHRLSSSGRASLLAAIDTLSSSEAWEHLRSSGQSEQSARRIIQAGLTALLTGIGD